eukprot:183340-Pyramimonas_sp.AAC.1
MTHTCSETETFVGDGALAKRRLRPTLVSASVGGETVGVVKPGSAPTTDATTAGVAADRSDASGSEGGESSRCREGRGV